MVRRSQFYPGTEENDFAQSEGTLVDDFGENLESNEEISTLSAGVEQKVGIGCNRFERFSE